MKLILCHLILQVGHLEVEVSIFCVCEMASSEKMRDHFTNSVKV